MGGAKAAEKGGDRGDGGGRNAWSGDPRLQKAPVSLGVPPLTHRSAAAWPLRAASQLPGYCARCCPRVSAGARPQTLLPSLHVSIRLDSASLSFLQEADLDHGMVSGVTPAAATPRVPDVSSLILIPTGVCFMDLTFTLSLPS